MNNLEGKVVEMLDALATQLGVATEYLWEVLVRQQYVEGFMNTVLAILGGLGMYFMYKLVKWGMGKDAEKNYDDAGPMAMIFGGVLFAVAFIVTIVGTLEGFGHFVNPEYYALCDVLELIN